MRSLETVARAKVPNRIRARETKLRLDRYERQDEPQIQCAFCHIPKPKGIEVSGRKGTDLYICDQCVCATLYRTGRVVGSIHVEKKVRQ